MTNESRQSGIFNGQFSCRLVLGTIQRKPENVNEPKDHSVLLKCWVENWWKLVPIHWSQFSFTFHLHKCKQSILISHTVTDSFYFSETFEPPNSHFSKWFEQTLRWCCNYLLIVDMFHSDIVLNSEKMCNLGNQNCLPQNLKSMFMKFSSNGAVLYGW